MVIGRKGNINDGKEKQNSFWSDEFEKNIKSLPEWKGWL